MICIELDENIEKKLEALCNANNRKKEDYVREALEEFLQEQEDILIAESRLHDGSDPTIGLEEMRRRLGLDD